ncbi:hypothetical protein E0I26_02515 [Flavobacterium rhamnosiphilum]|uniref:Uncharacterized protein n=1 Tax=Flavobacterium rhamnosiphilum TaxID=2541724 RepID=A0A4R5FCI9_9FLAO|nr:hypothetical protein [Flavobacterium rhamnosiphilum]TDE46979.1 hypothetical protein E0I26_02515 [Flavobacterium rhamnosiphilum]
MENLKLNDLSIADLKAALDFIQDQKKQFIEGYIGNEKPQTNSSFKLFESLEDQLHSNLFNRVNKLKTYNN